MAAACLWLEVMVPARVRCLMVAFLIYRKRTVPPLLLSVIVAVMACSLPSNVPQKGWDSRATPITNRQVGCDSLRKIRKKGRRNVNYDVG